jgi:predicted ATPase
MNKDDRKELQKAIDLIEEAKTIIEAISESEQEKFDNLSENLQATEKNQKLEENASSLNDEVSNLDDVIMNITELIEQ